MNDLLIGIVSIGMCLFVLLVLAGAVVSLIAAAHGAAPDDEEPDYPY